MVRHLRSLSDLGPSELQRVLELGAEVKSHPERYADKLAGKSVAMMFAKPSTRTRVSFEVGIASLGGHPLFLTMGGAAGLQVGRGESPHDTAKVLSRFVDAIVIRTFAQSYIEALAEHGSVPVVNALSDDYHPCQALADVLTMRERFGKTAGLQLTYVGPGNNVAHSLLLAGPRAGFDVVCASPAELPPDPQVMAQAERDATAAGTRVTVEHDPRAAVSGSQVVYTDTWVSMGQEDERDALVTRLAPYRVTPALMAAAASDAVFMHCLPAHRGEEVTDEVIDGPRSIVFDQAENRLHSQKALLLLLMGAEPWS